MIACLNGKQRCQYTVKALYSRVLCSAVFRVNLSSLEFNFADFELLHCYNALPKLFTWYLISRKQFIRKINPTRNLRLLQYTAIASSRLCNHGSEGY